MVTAEPEIVMCAKPAPVVPFGPFQETLNVPFGSSNVVRFVREPWWNVRAWPLIVPVTFTLQAFPAGRPVSLTNSWYFTGMNFTDTVVPCLATVTQPVGGAASFEIRIVPA